MRISPSMSLAQLLGLGAGPVDNTGTAQFSAQASPMSEAMQPNDGSNVLQSVLDAERQKRQDKGRKKREESERLYAEANSLQLPKPQPAIGGIKDLLLPLIAGLIGKVAFRSTDRDLAEGGAGFLNARQNQANEQNQFAQQQFQNQRQGLLGQAQGAERAADWEMGQADKIESDQRYQEELKYRREQALTTANDKRTRDAQGRYFNANTAGEKRVAANLWRKFDPDGAPGFDQVEEDVRQLGEKAVAGARKEWTDYVSTTLKTKGVIDEKEAAAMGAYRSSLAKRYGIDESAFSPIPSGDTLQKQHYKEISEQFDKTFKFRDKVWKDSAKQGWARIAALKAQVVIARESLGLREGQFNLSVNRLQWQIDKEYRGLQDSTDKELVKAQADLARERRVLVEMQKANPIPGNPKEPQGYRAEPGSAIAKQAEKVEGLEYDVRALMELSNATFQEGEDAAYQIDPSAGKKFIGGRNMPPGGAVADPNETYELGDPPPTTGLQGPITRNGSLTAEQKKAKAAAQARAKAEAAKKKKGKETTGTVDGMAYRRREVPK